MPTQLLHTMVKQAFFFGIAGSLFFVSHSNAQTLQYTFPLNTNCSQVLLDFPVKSTDGFQGRGAADMQLDMIVKAKVPTSTLQLLAKAGRYNLEVSCKDGKCVLDAPNLDKKIDLYGAEVQEQIIIKAILPENLSISGPQQLVSNNGTLPANIKIRIVLEGTAETSTNYGIAPSGGKPNNPLQGEKIEIE